MSDEHEDLGAAVADLEEALSALRSDLERDADAPEGELPPAERLRIVTEVAIPTLEGLLAANLRTLEATRTAVRSVQEETAAGAEADALDGSNAGADESSTDASGSRSSDADRPGADRPGAGRGDRQQGDAADRVDAAVEEVRSALDGSTIPEDAPGRDLLQEAQDLRAEIGSEADDASDAADRSDRTEIPIGESDDSAADADGRSDDDRSHGADSRLDDDPGPDAGGRPDDDPAHGADDRPDASEPQRTAGSNPDVDVDAELETIKQQVEHGGDLPSWSSDQSDGEWTFDDDDEPEDSGAGDRGADGDANGSAEVDTNGGPDDDTAGDPGDDPSGGAEDDADGGADDADGDPDGEQ